MVFTNYQGLTHQQLENFKRNLKKTNAEFVVIKNTLMKRSLADKNLSDSDKEAFKQPTGTMFMYGDPVEPLKVLAKLIKEVELPKVKFGLIDGKVVDSDGIMRLSTLPPLPILRVQLLGQMKSPIEGLHRALIWNIQSLVMTLNAIKDNKQ